MNMTIDRSRITSRYQIHGQLVMETALHIGSGQESSPVSDSPVVRDAFGAPLIPGSSIKGAFRAAVERLLPNLLPAWRTCQLVDGYPDCLSTASQDVRTAFGQLKEAVIRGEPAGQAVLDLLNRPQWAGRPLGYDDELEILEERLCDTCKTFGSVFLASAVHFRDLPVIQELNLPVQVRDGVGIDRDSDRAMDRIKFDYEVVPSQTGFAFRMDLEGPSPRDLALVALGLSELMNGMIPLGGIRSRGLGRCRLEEVRVKSADLSSPEGIRAYLRREWTEQPGPEFCQDHLGLLAG